MNLRPQQNLEVLKRLQALELWSARLTGGWLPGVARWEAKHELGRHLWEDAQHSRELRGRLWELRVTDPDRGLDSSLAELARVVGAAQHDYEFIAGLYLGLKSELLRAYENLARTTHAVYDAPTLPVLRRIAGEKRAQLAWAERALEMLTAAGEQRRLARRWVKFVRERI